MMMHDGGALANPLAPVAVSVVSASTPPPVAVSVVSASTPLPLMMHDGGALAFPLAPVAVSVVSASTPPTMTAAAAHAPAAMVHVGVAAATKANAYGWIVHLHPRKKGPKVDKFYQDPRNMQAPYLRSLCRVAERVAAAAPATVATTTTAVAAAQL
jgi:hypothetical protein